MLHRLEIQDISFPIRIFIARQIMPAFLQIPLILEHYANRLPKAPSFKNLGPADSERVRLTQNSQKFQPPVLINHL